MEILAVIPARYNSSRFPGKPLEEINGHPMIWWVYENVRKVKHISKVVVATEHELVYEKCMDLKIPVLMTSSNHETPTDRIYEVSNLVIADAYLFIGGDEPLLGTEIIEEFLEKSQRVKNLYITHAMTNIKSAPQVIDFTNIKVVVNSNSELLYTSRSPIPYPKGELNYNYKKFVGLGLFTKNALDFYVLSNKSQLEIIEECDLIRYLEQGKTIHMINVECDSISVDTPKDLKTVERLILNNK